MISHPTREIFLKPVDLKANPIYFNLALFCTQRRIVYPIAEQVQFCFKFLGDASLQLINFFRDCICHGTNSLTKNTTLTFDSLNLSIQSRELGSSVCALRWSIFAHLSLVCGIIALESSDCVMQFKYFFAEGKSFLLSHSRGSGCVHVSWLYLLTLRVSTSAAFSLIFYCWLLSLFGVASAVRVHNHWSS